MAKLTLTHEKLNIWTGLLTLLSALCAVIIFWLNWLNANYASRADIAKMNTEVMHLKRDLTLQMIEMRLTENENSLYEFEKLLRNADSTMTPRDQRQYQQLLQTKKDLLTMKRTVLKLN